MSQRNFDRLSLLIAAALFVASGIVVTRQGAPLRSRIDLWFLSREQSSLIMRDWDDIVSSGVHIGSATREPTLLIFFDYTCPFCGVLADTLESSFVDERSAALVLTPSQGNESARFAATAAACASEVGELERVHRYLLQSKEWKEHLDQSALASRAHLSSKDQFVECTRSSVPSALLARDSLFAVKIGLTSTPMTFSRDGKLARGLSASLKLLR